MPVRDPVRLDYVQRALGSMVEGWFGGDVAVRWRNQNATRAPLPYIELAWSSWPSRLAHPVERTLVCTTAATAILEGALDATERRTVWINGRPHHGEGASASAIATALAASITASVEPATATAGASSVSISSSEVGGISSIRGGPNVAIALDSTETVLEKTERRRAVLGVSAHSRLAARAPSAGMIVSDVLSRLTDRETRDLLRYARIGLTTVSPTRDLSGVQGPEIEARAQVDIGILLEARTATLTTTADRVVLSNATTQPPQETEIDL